MDAALYKRTDFVLRGNYDLPTVDGVKRTAAYVKRNGKRVKTCYRVLKPDVEFESRAKPFRRTQFVYSDVYCRDESGDPYSLEELLNLPGSFGYEVSVL